MALNVASTETVTVDTTLYADGINLDGTLNIAGTVNTTDSHGTTATGSGSGLGTATATAEYQATAAGIGEAFARLELPFIEAGETLTVAADERRGENPINLAGTLNLDGTVAVTTTGPDAINFANASGNIAGSGSALGTANADPVARAVAAGLGEGVGTADADTVLPLLRTTSAAISEDRTTEVTVSNDRTDDFTTQGRGETE